MRIRAIALEVTSIVIRRVVEVIPQTKRPDHAGWPGLGAAQKARRLRESSCRHWVRRAVRPTLWVAGTTTDERTHQHRAHVSVQSRATGDACQPDTRRIGIRTRVFSHSTTSSVAFPVAGANLSVRVSTGAPSDSVVTVPAPTSPARTSLSMGTPQRWTPRFTTICHLDAPGIAYRVYLPGSTRTPAICAGN